MCCKALKKQKQRELFTRPASKQCFKTSGLTQKSLALPNYRALSAKEIIDSLTNQIRDFKLAEIATLARLEEEEKNSPREALRCFSDSNNNKRSLRKSPISFRKSLASSGSTHKKEIKKEEKKKSEKIIKGSVRSKSVTVVKKNSAKESSSQINDISNVFPSSNISFIPRDNTRHLPSIITRSLSSISNKSKNEIDLCVKTFNPHHNNSESSEKPKTILEVRIPFVTVLTESESSLETVISVSSVRDIQLIDDIDTIIRGNEGSAKSSKRSKHLGEDVNSRKINFLLDRSKKAEGVKLLSSKKLSEHKSQAKSISSKINCGRPSSEKYIYHSGSPNSHGELLKRFSSHTKDATAKLKTQSIYAQTLSTRSALHMEESKSYASGPSKFKRQTNACVH